MIDPIDNARALHQHAADLRDAQSRFGDLLEEVDQTLIVLERHIDSEVYVKLSNRVTRLKEMRNGMELGSFSFALDRAAEAAAQRIMNPPGVACLPKTKRRKKKS